MRRKFDTELRVCGCSWSLAALCVAAFVPACLAQYSWTGGAGTLEFCNPNNWDPVGPPMSGASILVQGANGILDVAGCGSPGIPTFASIFATSPLRFAGIGFEIGGALDTANAQFDCGSNSVRAQQYVLRGETLWRNAVLRGRSAGSVATNVGLLRIGPAPSVRTLSHELRFANSAAVVQASSLSLTAGGTISNAGTWTMDDNLSIEPSGAVTGAEGFENEGTLIVDTQSPSPVGTFINVPLASSGSVDVRSGSLRVGAAARLLGGSAWLGASTNLTFASAVTVSGPLSLGGQGTILIDGGGTIEEPATVTASLQSGTSEGLWLSSSADVTLLGQVHSSGRVRWSNGRLTRPTITAGGHQVVNETAGRFLIERFGGEAPVGLHRVGIQNFGMLDVNSGFQLDQGFLSNEAGGMLRLNLDGALFDPQVQAPSSVITNRGTLEKSADTLVRLDRVSLRVYGGNVRVTAGTLAIGGAVSNPSIFDGANLLIRSLQPGGMTPIVRVSSGRVDVVGGVTSLIGSSTTSGQFEVSGTGEMAVEAGSRVESWITRSPALTVGGLRLAGGSLSGHGAVWNLADMVWNSGIISIAGVAIGDASGLVNRGSLEITGAGNILIGRISNDAENSLISIQNGGPALTSTGIIENHRGRILLRSAGSIGRAFGDVGTLLNTTAGSVVRGVDSGFSSIECNLDNSGLVRVESGTLAISGPIAQVGGDELLGGRWDVLAGATLSLGRIIRRTTGSAELDLDGTCNDYQPNFNSARVRVGGSKVLPGPGHLENQGWLRLDGSLSSPGRFTQNSGAAGGAESTSTVDGTMRFSLGADVEGGSLSGSGRVGGPVRIRGGTLKPGNSPGVLTIEGACTFEQGGTLEIELAGLSPGSQHDVIEITGVATLGGTLAMRVLPGFSPQTGQAFDILNAPVIAGSFGRLEAHGLRSDQRAEVAVLGDHVRLSIIPACPADLDDGTGSGTPDGGITIEDLLYYLDQYAQGTTRADLDDGSGTGTHDGGVTIDDLLYFLVRYTAGC